MHPPNSWFHRRLALAFIALILSVSFCPALVLGADDPLDAAVEAARKTHDEKQLQFVMTQLEQRVAENPNDAASYYNLARVQSYLLDVYELRKDKKNAGAEVDKAIEAAQHSIALNDKSADAHSLLADLYGRKISLGNGMFAGPKFGPKVKEENAKAMALDDKNPRVWASLGRQYLMAPKRFGGDLAKAVESFQKSLAIDSSQDEAWVWLARAFAKQGDKPHAHEAIQKALGLNPGSPFVKAAAAEIQ
jgi:cytochrome c-type biogenesis protein CcmH/NrfG